LATIVEKLPLPVEIILKPALGAYVAFADVLAEVRAAERLEPVNVIDEIESAIRIEQQRDLDRDAEFGILQLQNIAWTSISTAKSNPAPGILVIHSLRNIMACWSEQSANEVGDDLLPIVYTDNPFVSLLVALENLFVVASESMQPQTATEILNCFAIMLPRLPRDRQDQAQDIVLRSLSALGEHVLTPGLDEALDRLAVAFSLATRETTARKIRDAHLVLQASVGKVGSRATRVSNSQPREGNHPGSGDG